MTKHTGPAMGLVIVLCFVLVGCTGYRIVVEPYDPDRSLQETTVLADEALPAHRGEKIAMIPYEGVIATGERFSLLGRGKNPVSTFVESLNKARGDADVRAVIVYLNTPGGTVTASDILYQEIQRFKAESNKPVIVLMGDIAASGGFYLACAGDAIIAHPTTITGSIGVLIQLVNVSEGLSMIGIRAKAVTSGPNKNMGSPFEPEKPDHRALFQDMVDTYYARFVSVVTERRPNLSEADLTTATDGRVLTGEQAEAIGLIDSTGYLYDAFAAAKKRAGLGTARLVRYHREGEYLGSAFATAHASSDQPSTAQPSATPGVNVNMFQLNAFTGPDPLTPPPGPTFYYLWSPEAWSED